MTLKQLYTRFVDTNSDINEHLPTLKEYGEKCSTITEFGTRSGYATVALLMSEPTTMVSYDLFKDESIVPVLELLDNFTFEQHDTLAVAIDETDLLFIDTLHRYFQLYNELGLHSKKVKSYIIMHDTTTYGETDEPMYSSNSNVLASDKVVDTDSHGLQAAIDDFLNTTKDGANWSVEKIYTNNNGLTILKRNSVK